MTKITDTTKKTKTTIEIYTDGSIQGNPGGPGGFAAILLKGEKKKVVSGFDPDTTNNRMELRGPIAGMMAIEKPSHIKIYTDSEYVYKGFTQWLQGWKSKGWKTVTGKRVTNMDLWMTLERMTRFHKKVEWEWVKGHSGDKYNELADVEAAKALERGKKEWKRNSSQDEK